MAKFTYDHIHLRSPDPEATASWYERMLGAEVVRTMQQGKPRIDLKLGGANVFIAPVAAGDGVNPPPVTPYQGLDHFGLTVSGIDAVVPSSRPRASSSPASPPRCGRARASPSCARPKASRSSCSTALFREFAPREAPMRRGARYIGERSDAFVERLCAGMTT